MRRRVKWWKRRTIDENDPASLRLHLKLYLLHPKINSFYSWSVVLELLLSFHFAVFLYFVLCILYIYCCWWWMTTTTTDDDIVVQHVHCAISMQHVSFASHLSLPVNLTFYAYNLCGFLCGFLKCNTPFEYLSVLPYVLGYVPYKVQLLLVRNVNMFIKIFCL